MRGGLYSAGKSFFLLMCFNERLGVRCFVVSWGLACVALI